MRSQLIALSLLLAPLTPLAPARASDRLELQGHRVGLSIGLSLPVFPELVQVPGYPVYYAPRVAANYFFHDGLYWVFSGDRWYASAWYDGPWDEVAPYDVPAFVLRVPVRYYRRPPAFFVGWRHDAAPRWGVHWGRDWEQRRSGWDRWDRHADWRPAPLPAYQRQYHGDRYPRTSDRQRAIHSEHSRPGPADGGFRPHGGSGWDDGGRSRGDDRGRGHDQDRGRGGERGRGRGDDHGRGGEHERGGRHGGRG